MGPRRPEVAIPPLVPCPSRSSASAAHERHSSRRRSPRQALTRGQRREGRSQNSVLPEVLLDERGHLLERPLGDRRGEILQKTFALALEDRDLDLAAGLTILPDEL